MAHDPRNTVTMNPLIGYPGHELLLPDIVRAENCHLYDAAGKRYVDLESGVWCTVIGHGHPRVLRALAEQSTRIAHTGYCYSSAIVAAAARRVLALLGFEGGHCVFLTAGSEAVEFGVRAAQAISTRPLLMTMTDSYFGAYGSASRRRPDEWFSFDWSPCAACPHAGDACGEHCDHWAGIPFDAIGGFLFEPGSSSGLVRFPPEKLIRSLVAAVRAQGGLLLVNEVTTGVGRTGRWFGHQHYGYTPDIVALGKGLGNGYPVSVTAFAPSVIERLSAGPVKYAQSHQNDPLGAAVALAVIEAIEEEGLIERGRGLAAHLLAGLEAIQARHPRLAAVRSRGLMVALEFADDSGGTFTRRVQRELLGRGYVVAQRIGLPVIRVDPSLTIDCEDLDGFLATLAEVLAIPAHDGAPRGD